MPFIGNSCRSPNGFSLATIVKLNSQRRFTNIIMGGIRKAPQRVGNNKIKIMSLELTVIDHQNVHHFGQKGKSQWKVSRDKIDPLLKKVVENNEQALRLAIQDERISREPNSPRRNVFYVAASFNDDEGKSLFPKEYYPESSNGVCIEVSVCQYGEDLKADIHGFPVTVTKKGVSLSMCP